MIVKNREHLHHIDTFDEYKNIYAVIIKIEDEIVISYKIIYGHYYNDDNLFIYKNVRKGKIINYEVFICEYDELLYNTYKILISSTSYDLLAEQIAYYMQINSGKFPIIFTYDNVLDTMLATINSDCLRINMNINYDDPDDELVVLTTNTDHLRRHIKQNLTGDTLYISQNMIKINH